MKINISVNLTFYDDEHKGLFIDYLDNNSACLGGTYEWHGEVVGVHAKKLKELLEKDLNKKDTLLNLAVEKFGHNFSVNHIKEYCKENDIYLYFINHL